MMKAFKNSGFSLIELMIVVAIISIIAAIAYPAYMGYAQRSNRSDARVALSEFAQRLERCYTSFNVYNSANCTVVNDLGLGVNSESNFYRITGVIVADGYTLTATAITMPQTNDTGCGAITLTNTGDRDPAACW